MGGSKFPKHVAEWLNIYNKMGADDLRQECFDVPRGDAPENVSFFALTVGDLEQLTQQQIECARTLIAECYGIARDDLKTAWAAAEVMWKANQLRIRYCQLTHQPVIVSELPFDIPGMACSSSR